MPPHTLPTPRTFLKDLLSSLPAPAPESDATTTPSNPLASLAPPSKNLLLTLHVLFPHEFLPALDLLDRRLVTRFRIRQSAKFGLVSETASRFVVDNATPPAGATGIKQDGRGGNENEDALELAPASTASRGSSRRASANDNEGVGGLVSADTEMLERGEILPGIEPLAGGSVRQAGKEAGSGIQAPAIANVSAVQAASQTQSGLLTSASRAQPQDGIDIKAWVKHTEQEHSRIYYVRSAQQRASRYSTSVDTTTSYEVRLTAWNCSCPAFAFAAFPSALPEPVPPEVDESWDGEMDLGKDGAYLEDWSFGGVSLGTGTPPVCKHLLACVLIERCEMFKDFVEERDVSVEEAAGWAAGWGD